MNAWLTLEPFWRMATLVAAILTIATVFIGVTKLVRPRTNVQELVARVRSWWLMVVVFFPAIGFDPRLAVGFFGLISFWGLKEYLTLLQTRSADRAALGLAFLSVPIQYYWVWTGWYGMFIIFIPVYMFLLIPARLAIAGVPSGFVRAAGEIQWSLMAFVFGISHLAFLRTMPEIGEGSGIGGQTLLLFLVFVVQMNDVMQFVWGKSLGRRKVMPTISPNKTWEGLIGGACSAVGLSLLVRFLTPFSVVECMLVTAGVAILGFLGDVVLSAVKRDFQVKDFSATLPGHGGVLDRLDSLCWAGPVFFHYIRYIHYA